MNYSKLEVYKVSSTNDCIVIHGKDVKVPKANEHIIADMPTIAEYLVRYHEHRCRGLPPLEAHDEAMKGAIVVKAS